MKGKEPDLESWGDLWVKQLDRFVEMAGGDLFDTPLWYDERPHLGFLIQALSMKHGDNVFVLCEAIADKQRRPDLWLKMKDQPGATWIEAKCCEADYGPRKGWEGKTWLGLAKAQRSHAETQLRKNKRPDDRLVRIHFIISAVTVRDWKSRPFDIAELEEVIVTKVLKDSPHIMKVWVDSRFNGGNIPKGFKKQDPIYPAAFFVAEMLK